MNMKRRRRPCLYWIHIQMGLIKSELHSSHYAERERERKTWKFETEIRSFTWLQNNWLWLCEFSDRIYNHSLYPAMDWMYEQGYRRNVITSSLIGFIHSMAPLVMICPTPEWSHTMMGDCENIILISVSISGGGEGEGDDKDDLSDC